MEEEDCKQNDQRRDCWTEATCWACFAKVEGAMCRMWKEHKRPLIWRWVPFDITTTRVLPTLLPVVKYEDS